MTRPMTEADVLAAAQARLLSALVVTNARTLVSIPGVGPEFWAAYGNLRGAVQRLDDELLDATIATSEQIVRTGPVYDLPCGHTVFDACEACTPDPDAEVFDIPGRTDREADFLDRWRADVAARADEFERGGSL
jgi:hypothetical protein